MSHSTAQTISETVKKLDRWTPLTFVFPEKYVEDDLFWQTFDIVSWSRNEFSWMQDGWNGYRDFAKEPRQTVHDRYGDCEDYALVAASWALSNNREPVTLGFCWEKWKPHPTHVVCHDGEQLFSSGRVLPSTREAYRERSKYDAILWREVSR